MTFNLWLQFHCRKSQKKNTDYFKSTYFCELSKLDLSLTLRQFSSFAIVTWRFFSGNIGDGSDLGVVGVVEPGDEDLDGGGAKVSGGGARVIGGSRAFSAPN